MIVMGLWLFGAVRWPGFDYQGPSFTVFSCGLIALASAVDSLVRGRVRAILTYSGSVTLGVYCCHFPIMKALVAIGAFVGFPIEHHGFLFSIALFSVAFCAASSVFLVGGKYGRRLVA